MKLKEGRGVSKDIWFEYFRPITCCDVLLPKRLKLYFDNIVKSGNIPNLLLHSTSPGVGKTSLAKALCEDLELDYKYVNCSNERGIDVLRDKIQRFASSKSMDGRVKCMILDEFDGTTSILQKALKADIESFHNTCRFIFTANEIELIIEPIQSRCQCVDMNMSATEEIEEMQFAIADRLSDIFLHLGVKYDEDALIGLMQKYYPDMRKMLEVSQQFYTESGFINSDVTKFKTLDDSFYNLVLDKDYEAARQYLLDIGYDFRDIWTPYYEKLVPMLPKKMRGEAILIIADYMGQSFNSTNPQIQWAAATLELIALL